MIELRITGETPKEFLENVIVAHAALIFRNQVAQVGAAAAVAGAKAESLVTEKTSEQPVEDKAVPVEDKAVPVEDKAVPVEPAPKRGRPKAEKPAVEPQEAKPVETAPAEPVETPKDVEAMRALMNMLIQVIGPQPTADFINKFGQKISLIPVDKYPDMARQAHKLLAGGKS